MEVFQQMIVGKGTDENQDWNVASGQSRCLSVRKQKVVVAGFSLLVHFRASLMLLPGRQIGLEQPMSACCQTSPYLVFRQGLSGVILVHNVGKGTYAEIRPTFSPLESTLPVKPA